MVHVLLSRFAKISLTKRFAIASFTILLTGMLVIGWWITREIESGVMNRTASVTASFVTSSVAPHLQSLSEGGEIGLYQMEALDRLLFETELGQRIVSFKVWSPDGQVLYSPQREMVGTSFGVGPNLRKALDGETVSHISNLSDPENEYERQRFSRLQETYTPLRLLGTGEVLGAVEFYERTEALAEEIQDARLRSWFVVGTATLAMYLILVGMVKGASLTIGHQRQQLEQRIGELDKAVSYRQMLNRQLSAVSAIAMAANEVRDQQRMLQRCLEIVSEHTQMETSAIRLLDAGGSHLTVASAQGTFAGLPCQTGEIGLNECACGNVASEGSPLYLSADERLGFQPPCQAPPSHSVAILPLRSPKGVLGVLSLSTAHGEPPKPEERETLDAICNQIAIAIENARLMSELGRVEAQRELDRMKAEFISAVSHELRTPLGFIKGYAATLLRDDISVDAATHREFLQVIDEESNKLQGMIDELLDTSRLRAGGLQIDLEAVHLSHLLSAVLQKAAPALRQAGHALETNLPSEDPQVLADAGRVEQVLHNLLDNAARYSDPGSPITLAASIEDQGVRITVTDHGDGIPDQEIERVFEPFYRGENSLRRGARGTGLGLAICAGIISSHGSKLSVESVPGKGSTFAFTLPLVTESAIEGTDMKDSSETPVVGNI